MEYGVWSMIEREVWKSSPSPLEIIIKLFHILLLNFILNFIFD